MSKPISRRTAIAAAAGGFASVPIVNAQAAVHSSAFPLVHDCDLELLELRRAIDDYQVAVLYELRIEGTPGHAAAVSESEARETTVQALVDAIYERTPVSTRDVALRAEALRKYFFGGHRECIEEWEARDCTGQDYAFAKLYEAAAIVAGGEANG